MEIAVLFTDLRGFTTMTEKRLPYDVVFLMNRYFHAMGETIEGHGGHLVQVFGDGIMALFGLDEGVERGCRAALRVARAMAEKLDELNEHHPLDLAEPLRMIAANAGVEGAIVVERVKASDDLSFGYNAATDKYEDLIKAGVIDPTLVVRTALQNAASIAGLLLTTEAVVVKQPEDAAAAPPMPGGGMDGMY